MLGILIGERVIDGKQCVWVFRAQNKVQGRKRANAVLFFDGLGAGGGISYFSPDEGYWKAVPVWLAVDEVRSFIEKADKSKIVEIKRRRPPTIDVLYITRRQKEREQK